MLDRADTPVSADRLHQTPPAVRDKIADPFGLPAAQYIRMSTERQCYSTENQIHLIADYARAHGMIIVRTFSDEGKSGITIDRRSGLLSLFSAVQSGLADFKAILVYDVSRWGRFQDIDESGYWEYVCKQAGVAVHYCAEPFINDGSLPSVILKSLKRTMAAEYSRELSAKVFAGKCRLAELGYRQGGTIGYGLRRMLVDEENQPRGLLADGQLKSIQSDRVIVVLGPEEEQRIIREIFHAFVYQGKTQSGIAKELNARGIPSGNSRPWAYHTVHEILVNPKYIGTNVINRRSVKLRAPMVRNPEQLWVRKDNAFPGIISQDLFLRAANIFEERNHRSTEDEMLEQLRSVLATKGRLTADLINKSPGIRSATTFCARFGNLRIAYKKLGYLPHCDLSYLSCTSTVRTIRANLLNDVISKLEGNGAIVEKDCKTSTLMVNRNLSLRLAVVKCLKEPNGHLNWRIPRRVLLCDLNIVARLNENNNRILDYFIFPLKEHPRRTFFVATRLSASLELYRFETLDYVYQACRRSRVGDSGQ